MTSPELSVLLAVAPGHPDFDQTLDSLRRALHGMRAEILMIGGESIAATTVDDALTVRHIAAPPDTLVPVAWGIGVTAAAAPIVACLSSEFEVTEAWATALLPLVHDEVVGAAGALTVASGASAATRAMYLLRYAPFLPTGGPPVARENIPGDGALYQRDRILEHPDLLSEGFWEIEFHRRWLAAGLRLLFDPASRVSFRGPVPLADGMALRYRHGAVYGSTMVLRHSNSRLRHILPAPILPFVLTGRILRRVWANGAQVATWLPALPALLALTAAWSSGEAVGAVTGRGGPH